MLKARQRSRAVQADWGGRVSAFRLLEQAVWTSGAPCQPVGRVPPGSLLCLVLHSYLHVWVFDLFAFCKANIILQHQHHSLVSDANIHLIQCYRLSQLHCSPL